MMTLTGIGIVVLPNPDLADAVAWDFRVDSKRSMNSTKYTYVQTTSNKKFTYQFSNLSRNIVIQLQAFHRDNAGRFFALIDHNSITRNVVFADDNISINTERAGFISEALRDELGSVTLTVLGA